MKPTQEKYNKIPSLVDLPFPVPFFVHIPGVYCIQCGEVFALYSFSIYWPKRRDENGKPYYTSCFKCRDD